MKEKVVILGGGIGGLSTGWMLARAGRYAVTVVEHASMTGGVCGTFGFEDFLLDYGPHKSYSAIEGITDELKGLMKDEFLEHQKRNSIFMFNNFLNYPLRMTDLTAKMGLKNLLHCGFNAIEAIIRGKTTNHGQESYETWMVDKFGRKLYELVFEPLADKIWGDPTTLSHEIARTRFPSTSILDVAMRALGLRKESRLTDAEYFFYPRCGFGRIPKRMEEEIIKSGGSILTNTKPTEIIRTRERITAVRVCTNGNSNALPCDLLISSIPPDFLVSLLEENELKDALEAAKRLQYRNAVLVYVFLNREMVTDHHWIFFPESDVIFGRIFEQKQMSAEMCPRNRTVVCCDFTDYEDGRLWNQSDEQLADQCISDLMKVGMIEKSWVERSFVKRLPRFYPRYDLLYKETLTTLYNFLKRYTNLLPTGRIGFYNYNNSDHCVDMGKYIAENLESGRKPIQIWTGLEQRVAGYRIVD